MTPDFELLALERNVTQAVRDRLLSLTVTDEAGWQSDTLSLKLDNRFPPIDMLTLTDTELTLKLGYQETGLYRVGLFVVDEVSIEGPPASLTIRARAANFTQSLKDRKTRSWEQVSLKDIVSKIAAEHELDPAVAEDLAGIAIEHIDQTEESDLHFLTRIARDYGAIAKPVEGRLLLAQRGKAKTLTNQNMPTLTLKQSDLSDYRFTLVERNKYVAVAASYHITETNTTETITAGEENGRPIYRLPGLQPDQSTAQYAARAKLDGLARGELTGSISLPGNAQLMAEGTVKLLGFNSPMDGDWVINRVEHDLSASGFISKVDIKTK